MLTKINFKGGKYMSQDLQGFYAQNAEKLQNHKAVISNRFKDSEGNPIEFEFKAISNQENLEIRKECTTKKVISQGPKKGQIDGSFDEIKYQTLMVIKSFVFPNLRDVKLQESYGVMNEYDLYNAMFTAAEAQDCYQAADKANSHEKGMPELVEEVKN